MLLLISSKTFYLDPLKCVPLLRVKTFVALDILSGPEISQEIQWQLL